MNKKYLIACLLDSRDGYEKAKESVHNEPAEKRDNLVEYYDDHIEAVDNAVFVLNHLSWIAAAATVALVCAVASLLLAVGNL